MKQIHITDQIGRPAGISDSCSYGQSQHLSALSFVRMRKGEEGEKNILFREAGTDPQISIDRRVHAEVGVDDSFSLTGGAGGIHDGQLVMEVYRAPALIVPGRIFQQEFPAQFPYLIQGYDLRMIEIVLHKNDLFQSRHLIPDIQGFF
jgi:hypothetical protein